LEFYPGDCGDLRLVFEIGVSYWV